MTDSKIVTKSFLANNKVGTYVFNGVTCELFIEHEDIPNGKIIYGAIESEDVQELYGLVNHMYDLLNYRQYRAATDTITTFVENGLSFPEGAF
jgi:hypothetical protein